MWEFQAASTFVDSTACSLCGSLSACSACMFARALVEKIVDLCSKSESLRPYGLLFLLTYCFLLRLPSEALPAVAGPDVACYGHQSTLCLEGDELVLYLKRRKNKPNGSRLVRACWCRQSSVTCPVHVIGKALRPGLPLFQGITPHLALVKLRECLVALTTPSAGDYRTHDLRRGHALDLQCSGELCVVHSLRERPCRCTSGASLAVILQAGEWSSPAFLSYLDCNRLEGDVVVSAHCDESSSDDEP